jgi:hypothetical protein
MNLLSFLPGVEYIALCLDVGNLFIKDTVTAKRL